MINIIAIITAKPGMRDHILQAARENKPAVLAEPGCIEYNPVIDAADAGPFKTFGPDTLVFIEKWDSMAALQAHGASAHMRAYGAKVKDWTASRQIYVLEPV